MYQAKIYGISYVCCNCGTEEKIPVEVLEEFDELYLEQLLLGGHQFKCEKCAIGIMKEKKAVQLSEVMDCLKV